VVYIHKGVIFRHKDEWNYVTYRIMDGTGDLHIKKSKADWAK
jgi:hypothetical protein